MKPSKIYDAVRIFGFDELSNETKYAIKSIDIDGIYPDNNESHYTLSDNANHRRDKGNHE